MTVNVILLDMKYWTMFNIRLKYRIFSSLPPPPSPNRLKLKTVNLKVNNKQFLAQSEKYYNGIFLFICCWTTYVKAWKDKNIIGCFRYNTWLERQLPCLSTQMTFEYYCFLEISLHKWTSTALFIAGCRFKMKKISGFNNQTRLNFTKVSWNTHDTFARRNKSVNYNWRFLTSSMNYTDTGLRALANWIESFISGDCLCLVMFNHSCSIV